MKVISIGQNMLFKLHFGLLMTRTSSKMIWLRERERDLERDSGRERREIKTERQADGWTLIFIKLH